MKNKDGFTLVELLVVVALLGLIITVAAPSIMKSVRKTNLRLCYNKSDLILSAAELYAQDGNGLTYNNNESNITVNDLIIKGYLEADEKDTTNCSITTYSNGCMIEPLTKVVLNSNNIKISIINNKTFKAVWVDGDICYEE